MLGRHLASLATASAVRRQLALLRALGGDF